MLIIQITDIIHFFIYEKRFLILFRFNDYHDWTWLFPSQVGSRFNNFGGTLWGTKLILKNEIRRYTFDKYFYNKYFIIEFGN